MDDTSNRFVPADEQTFAGRALRGPAWAGSALGERAFHNRPSDERRIAGLRSRSHRGTSWMLAAVGCVVVASCGHGGEVTAGPSRPVSTTNSSIAISQPAVVPTTLISAPAPVETPPPTPAPTEPTTPPLDTTTVAPTPEPTIPAPLLVDPVPAPPADNSTPVPVQPAFSPVPPVAPDAAAGAFATFDRLIGQETIGKGALTLGIAVAYNGQIVHQATYGLEDVRSGEPPTPASRFRIASISKVITATVVMQLVEAGLVTLDETFLPSLGVPLADPRSANITVRQLLSHTSGLPVGQPVFFRGRVSTWQEASATLLAEPLETDPGTTYKYSNANFTLLGSLIEQRTGKTYEQAVRDYLLTPLGLNAMRIAGTFDTQIGDVFHPSTAGRNYMESLGPAGQWIASPTDVMQLLIALQNGVPVSATLVDLMRTAVDTVEPNPQWRYGLGLRLRSDDSWGHSGTLEHAKAMALVRPDGWGACILVNGEVPGSTDTLATLIDMALASMG